MQDHNLHNRQAFWKTNFVAGSPDYLDSYNRVCFSKIALLLENLYLKKPDPPFI